MTSVPRLDDGQVTVYLGDCLDVLPQLADDSVDAVVTDPPYDLTAGKKGGSDAASVNLDSPYGRSRIGTGNGGFMGKDWDATGVAFDPDTWRQVLRVLKPGGHLLAFGGTRTYHRLASAIEDAGFEIRDCIAWLYGSGFPKSVDVSKGIDRAMGVEREVVGVHRRHGGGSPTSGSMSGPLGTDSELPRTVPATPEAEQWEGWGTALKPAHEPIVLARKSTNGTVVANVLEHGTGAMNIDACRVKSEGERIGPGSWSDPANRKGEVGSDMGISGASKERFQAAQAASVQRSNDLGRWPSNVTLDPTAADALDAQTGVLTSGANPERRGSDKFRDAYGEFKGQEECKPARGADEGGASRFFPVFRYEAKAGNDERPKVDGVAHPTVKPVALLRWLIRLVTPPDGVVLDPFLGSGTTAQACIAEGFRCIGIEREEDYIALIEARLHKPIQAGFALGDIA